MSRRNVASLRRAYSFGVSSVNGACDAFRARGKGRQPCLPSAITPVTLISCIPWRSTCFESLRRYYCYYLSERLPRLCSISVIERVQANLLVSSCLLPRIRIKHDQSWLAIETTWTFCVLRNGCNVYKVVRNI